MAEYKSRLSKQTFPCYLKLGLALKIMKYAVRGMVEAEAAEFHQSILQEFPKIPSCSNCQLENILECRTNGYSKKKNGLFHNFERKQPRSCPNQICNTVRDKIREAHRTEPSWRNTDIRRWGADPFQIFKCFLPPYGYENANSFADIDFNGFLYVITNNRRYEDKMSVNLSDGENVYSKVQADTRKEWGKRFKHKKGNTMRLSKKWAYNSTCPHKVECSLFEKAINIGKTYHHSNSLTISQTELHIYINVLTDLLTDSKYLLHCPRAKESVAKLKQLKEDTLSISTNEIKDILEEAIGSIDKASKAKEQSTVKEVRLNKETHDVDINELKLKVFRDCRNSFSHKPRKIKISQMESVVYGQTSAINKLKDVTMDLQNTQDRGILEEQKTVPFQKTMKKTEQELKPPTLSQPSAPELESYHQSKIGSGTALWERCDFSDENAVRICADNLIEIGVIPDQIMLNKLCKMFGKKDKLIITICQKISVAIREQNSKIVSVWPTYLCPLLSTTLKSEIVFVVISKETLSPKETKKIVYAKNIRLLGKYSKESRYAMLDKKCKNELSMKETETLKKCINTHATGLMKRHSFLSVIAPSPVRSKRDKLGRFHAEREPCIALYVHTKGYIPLGEEPFRKEYDGIPVDVREGIFETQPGTSPSEFHEILKMGCQIGNEPNRSTNETLSGTLGGFIDHPHYGLCGFTSAHVLINKWGMEQLKSKCKITWPHFNSYGTVYQPAGSNNSIGRLVHAEYAEGHGNCSGIEVALFQIERRHPNAGDFPAMPLQAHEDELRCDSGKVQGSSRINNDPVVKFGSFTHKTEGEFVLTEAATSVRTSKQIIDANQCQITLHNQLEVKPKQSRPDMKFSDFGDSGSLVFVKGSDGDYTCVGMVEGGTTYGSTIVTPITPILEAFKVSTLKSFKIELIVSDLRTTKEEINTKLETIMQELREIKSRLPDAPQHN